MLPLVSPHLSSLVPYVPGKPIAETEREYGVTNLAKLASNENPLGPSPKAVEAGQKAMSELHLYPDAGAYYLKQRLLERHADHNVTAEQLVLGNGTNEIISLMAKAFLADGEALLNAWPSFVCYRMGAKANNKTELAVPLTGDLDYDLVKMAEVAQNPGEEPVKMVFVGNPNNPTGKFVKKDALDAFIGGLPADVICVIDEAYAEYVTDPEYPDAMAWVQKRPRTVVTRTFSKIFGLAALRVGYAVCDPAIADILNRLRDPFNVNTVGQAAALAALDDEEHLEKSRAHNDAEMPFVTAGLSELGLSVTPSVANFVLAEMPAGAPVGKDVFEGLIRRGVIVRPVGGYGLTRSVRITLGTRAENERLLTAMGGYLKDAAAQGAGQ